MCMYTNIGITKIHAVRYVTNILLWEDESNIDHIGIKFLMKVEIISVLFNYPVK